MEKSAQESIVSNVLHGMVTDPYANESSPCLVRSIRLCSVLITNHAQGLPAALCVKTELLFALTYFRHGKKELRAVSCRCQQYLLLG